MINLRHYNKTLLFILAFLAVLAFPILLPSLRVFYFVPALIVLFYQLNLINALWVSLGAGLVIDCLSVHSFFGLNAFVYCLTTLLLYPQRTYFFADRLTTLPLMSFLFSLCASVIFMAIAAIFDKKQLFSTTLLYYDFILMPGLDALYALIVFILPLQLLKKSKQSRKGFFRKRA